VPRGCASVAVRLIKLRRNKRIISSAASGGGWAIPSSGSVNKSRLSREQFDSWNTGFLNGLPTCQLGFVKISNSFNLNKLILFLARIYGGKSRILGRESTIPRTPFFKSYVPKKVGKCLFSYKIKYLAQKNRHQLIPTKSVYSQGPERLHGVAGA